MQRHKGRKGKPELTDAEVRAVLVTAMADVGADPALVLRVPENRHLRLRRKRKAVAQREAQSLRRRC